ncbi:MAG: ORF6N domain-containing protein [Candidatus Melainabacteria bacterium]|nr:ORF6N domain-containing protein [Candidatus Melainabacteria bacterium]
MSSLIAEEKIEKKIFLIRGKKVMLDKDLAELYGVKTKALNQAVKRNIERFPEDFVLNLSREEAYSLRSQFVTLKQGQHIKHLPYAFTEQGVAMLSSILKSKKAILVNIQIMRAFTRLKRLTTTHKELAKKINELETKVTKHDKEIQSIFDAIHKLIEPQINKPKRKVGFTPN